MYMQNTCSAHGPFFPAYQGERCPLCVQREVEEMLGFFEHWLSQGMYEQADERLKFLLVDTVAPAALLAALTITHHEKHKFKHREAFLARVEARLIKTLGAERAESLLRNRR